MLTVDLCQKENNDWFLKNFKNFFRIGFYDNTTVTVNYRIDHDNIDVIQSIRYQTTHWKVLINIEILNTYLTSIFDTE